MGENTTTYVGFSYINGQRIETDKRHQVISAINGMPIGYLELVTKKEVDLAYKSAHEAFLLWKNLSPSIRIKVVEQYAQKLLENKDKIAYIMTLEIAKAHKDCLSEIERTYQYIQETIKVYKEEVLVPKTIDESVHNIKNKVGTFSYEPIGVVLAISPFNYPVNLSLAKIIPAILAGNTVVFKAATVGSLIASYFIQLFEAIDLMPGVVNYVIGRGSEIGDYILESPLIAGVSFTGSTEIGKRIAAKLPMRHLVLELGGKDAAIVTKNADLDLAAKEIVKGAFNYSGQRCTAIKRVIVDEVVANQLIELVKEKTLALTVGNPMDDVSIVPLIDTKSLEYNQGLINDAIENGAKLVIGNIVLGYNLLSPTILDNVSLKTRIAWEEPFGPVLPFIRVNTLEEAININNQSNYGLQASVFSKDINEAKKIANLLDVARVNINKSSERGPDIFPFTGFKDSGFGTQGVKDALISMLKPKGIVFNE